VLQLLNRELLEERRFPTAAVMLAIDTMYALQLPAVWSVVSSGPARSSIRRLVHVE
jgi:hypothetical protein